MRRSRNPAPVIQNDRLEHDRIILEHNLRHSETAIHLSSATESDAEDDLESLEYPRHNSGPAPFNELPSLDHRVRDYLVDEDAPGHGWSYRTGDDYEEGINPYGGESLSTLAHHASAVTLGAGLGGRGARRDGSMSGAEYDPDRPIHEIIAGVTSKLSVFGADRSKRQALENITNDPYVVEDTAELDQILETGSQAHPQRSIHVASPVTSGSSSHSDLDQPNTTIRGRPKLSDALRNVTLSPKRPRSPQIPRSLSLSPRQQATSTLLRGVQRPSATHVATPRPARRNSVLSSKPPAPKPKPEVVLHPPTPSSASASSKGSKFTRMANGLAKEIEYEKGQLKMSQSTKRPEGSRSIPMPYGEGTKAPLATNQANTLRTSAKDKSRIQLPDVTGITNAIESPAKAVAEYYAFRTEGKLRETESRLLHTLNTVQKRIQQLEEENGISRRRVRELEMELEDCKREVARERTRLIEQEELLKQQAARIAKGKGRARDPLNDDSSHFHERYKEAVEEKKALEALISSLRTHLTRLTSELSSHRELLTELRTLRDADSATLREKGAEITRLKNEVERLAGEVEVLRGVVEEGLRERRAAKEASSQSSHQDEIHHDEFTEEEGEEDEEQLEAEHEDAGLSYASAGARNRTMRTDRATEGSEDVHDGRATRFMDSIDYERISAEIEERRSDHSGSIDISQFSHTRSPVQSPSPKSRRYKTAMALDESTAGLDLSMIGRRASSPDPISDPEEEDAFGAHSRQPGPSTRPRTAYIPKEDHDYELHTSRRVRTDVADEEPFPKIRGQRLERLFFAAPEHDARTCSTCNRRGRRGSDEHPVSSAWRNRRTSGGASTRSRHGSDEDEGFAEGSENLDERRHQHHPQDQIHGSGRGRGKPRERSLQDINEVPSIARQEGLPPQTIVARIIRELEDDFTHYKSIYIELADQYKEMDAASNVAQRNTLARHLREVVDILEQKGDQIASLYDQLSFKDKSVGGRGVGTRTR